MAIGNAMGVVWIFKMLEKKRHILICKIEFTHGLSSILPTILL